MDSSDTASTDRQLMGTEEGDPFESECTLGEEAEGEDPIASDLVQDEGLGVRRGPRAPPRSLAAGPPTLEPAVEAIRYDDSDPTVAFATPREACGARRVVMVLPSLCGPPGRAALALLRLPHPRHGRPQLYAAPLPSPFSSSPSSPPAGVPPLYEAQGQGPPGGHAQTWFVAAPGPGPAEVLPCDRVVVATPVGLVFFALAALVGNPLARERFLPAEELYRPQASPDGEGAAPWWPGWPTAAAAAAVLAPYWAALCSEAVLLPLCEVKRIADGAYYRFSPAKAAAWVAARVRRVRESAALATILQIRPAAGAGCAQPEARDFANPGEGPLRTADSPEDGLSTLQTVPIEIAFSVVAEYIPEAFHEEAGRAAGVVLTEGNLNSSTKVSEEPCALPSSKKTAKAASSTSATARGPVSASVRRLEKAGRPKGTPTLFSIFEKKK